VVRFRAVVHLVRHPLSAVNSNRHFSDHLKRCAKLIAVEFGAADVGGGGGAGGDGGEYCEWNWWRLQQWEYARIFTPAPPNATAACSRENEHVLPPPGRPGGFLLWSRVAPPRPPHEPAWTLRGAVAVAALHWRTWNALAASVADLTVRLEDGAAVVPAAAGGGAPTAAAAAQSSFATTAAAAATPAATAAAAASAAGASAGSAPSTICHWLVQRARRDGWPPWVGGAVDCDRPDAPRASPAEANSHGGGARPALTWAAVGAALEDAGLPAEELAALQSMAARLGYDSSDRASNTGGLEGSGRNGARDSPRRGSGAEL
jgi:hypothetical protein